MSTPRHRPDLDQGFTLVEVMVAFALVLVMATATLSVLGASAKVAANDGLRTVASNLAMRELEITREDFVRNHRRFVDGNPTNKVYVNQHPVGKVDPTTGNSEVDGQFFKVERSMQWRPVGSQIASTCDEGAATELDYLAVTVKVSWGRGSNRKLYLDTLMTPPNDSYDDVQVGHIGLKVIGAEGQPRQGVPVTVRSGSTVKSGTTFEDGCLLLDRLPVGTYTVTVSQPGSVTPAGQPVATVSAQVQNGQLWRGTVDYDKAATIAATFKTAPGFDLPAGLTDSASQLDITLGNSALLPYGSRAVAGSGVTRTISNLWPYPSGYQLWGGRCLDNDPQYVDPAVAAQPTTAPVADGGSEEPAPTPARELPVGVVPGTTASGDVALGPVEVTAPAGTTVVAVQPNRTERQDAQCQTGPRVTLGNVPAGGVLRTSLPFGSWTIQRASGGTATASVTVPAPPPGTFAAPVTASVP